MSPAAKMDIKWKGAVTIAGVIILLIVNSMLLGEKIESKADAIIVAEQGEAISALEACAAANERESDRMAAWLVRIEDKLDRVIIKEAVEW